MALRNLHRKTAACLTVVFTCYLLYIVLTLVYVSVVDYQSLVAWFKKTYPDAYLMSEFDTAYFTSDHHNFLKQFSIAMIVSMIAAILLIAKKWTYTVCHVSRLLDNLAEAAIFVQRSWQTLTVSQKSILTLCLNGFIAVKIFFFILLPHNVDEVFNFVFFANKGFFLTTTFSNNHVLYNLFSCAWSRTGLDPLFASRATSIIAAMFVHCVIFFITRHFFSFSIAIWTMTLTGVTLWFNVFSVTGTAYMTATCCLLIGFGALLQIFTTGGKSGHHLLILSTVLGMFASKLFVIPLTGLILTWIGAEVHLGTAKKNLQKILIISSAIVIFSSLLYFPTYIWSGSEALFATHLDKHSFFDRLQLSLETMSLTSDVNTKSYIVVAACMGLALVFFTKVSRKMKLLFYLALCNMVAIIVFTLVLDVFPPPRSLVYLNVMFFAIVALGISEFVHPSFKRSHRLTCYGILIALKIMASVYLFRYGWQSKLIGGIQDRNFYIKLNALAGCIVSSQPRMIFEDRHDRYLGFYIRLAALRNQQAVTFEYDPSQGENCDISIFYDEHTSKVPGHTLVGKSEFADVYAKESLRSRLAKPGCFANP